jgi:hypothetical protein
LCNLNTNGRNVPFGARAVGAQNHCRRPAGSFSRLRWPNEPHTFSGAELAGTLNRTGVHRIKGTQAPDINNGQGVSGGLTLAPFDAIILLADPIHLNTPAVTGVTNAAGGQLGGVSGSFVSIYGSKFHTAGLR